MPKKLTQEEILKRFKKVHKDKYNYSKVIYTGINNKVIINCSKHNEFLQTPYNHFKGHGCPKCSKNYNYTTFEIIEDFKKIHGDKYNYSKVNYINAEIKIKIICREHGEFLQLPYSHRIGNGCPKCQLLNTIEIIKRFKKIHGDTYNYEKIKFKTTNDKVKIICNIHGEFNQVVKDHFSGSGCPKCATEIKESKGERKIREFLEENNIKYSQEVKLFENYRFDFYLEDLNTVIEYDGKQHSEPVEYFGGLEGFLKTQERDRIKEKFLKENNIELLRINYKEFNNILTILTNITKT